MADQIPDNRAKYLQGKPKGLTAIQKLNLIKKILKTEFAVEYPVRFRTLDKDDPALRKLHASGYTWLVNAHKEFKTRYFLIVTSRSLTWAQKVDILIHEWAHAMTWDAPHGKDHGRDWADAYGKLYRRIIED